MIGLGGVGGIVARYLSLFLTCLQVPLRLVLIDGDEFEPENAARMAFSRFGSKAEVMCEDLRPFVDGSMLVLDSVAEYVKPENLPRLIHEQDIVILAVDNHATRKAVGEFCATKLRNVCLISGGNDGVGCQRLLLRGMWVPDP